MERSEGDSTTPRFPAFALIAGGGAVLFGGAAVALARAAGADLGPVAAVIGPLYLVVLALTGWGLRRLRRAEARLAAESGARQAAETRLQDLGQTLDTMVAERTRSLRESEARYRQFAESGADWLWETDEAHRFTFVSEGAVRVLGLGAAAVIGCSRGDLALDREEDPEKWRAHLDDLDNRRPFRGVTYRVRDTAGRPRYIAVSGSPVFDAGGRFRGYRGSGIDLTRAHLADRAIRRLGRVIDQVAEEIYILDAETWRFDQVNRGGRRNLGYSLEELCGMTLLDVEEGTTVQSIAARLAPLRRRPSQAAVVDTAFRRKDGSRYPVEMRLQYMPQERPPVFAAIVQDVTARRAAEQALAESEERYRLVAEMSLDGIVAHKDGVIVHANSRAEQVAGATGGKGLVGRPIGDLVPDAVRARLTPADGTPDRVEVSLTRLDGTPFEAEVAVSPISYGGAPAEQVVLRDITERKAVQAHLLQTAKLATLGQMAAGMAHELSQPMNIIRMAAEGAQLAGPDGTKAVDTGAALDMITAQAARMGEIIDHMRIFSRKEDEAAVEVFSPIHCVTEAVNMVEAQFHAEDILIVARYPRGEPQVRGTRVHLEQVLLNLLSNARDAIRARWEREETARPGRITIDVAVAEPGDTLTITVTDTGGGIPAAILERVFEPFYTTKEVGSGTGLGLSLSFSLISAMGGDLTACNAGEGAAFTVSLPLCRTAGAADGGGPAAARPGVPGAGAGDTEAEEPSALLIHVLVVDDEPYAVQLMTDHLGHHGYRVTAAANGEDAYALFLEDPADVVITDLRMPHLDGMALMRRLHAHVPDLPVIVVTGHLGHLEAVSGEITEEAAAILRKPVSLAHLREVVESLTGNVARLTQTASRSASRSAPCNAE